VPASTVFVQPTHRVDLANPYNWWTYIPGAQWRHPQGPDSTIADLGEHPVVHVAWDDVEAYANLAGRALPTEAEWEFAARGGLDAATYAWGDEFNPDGQWMANTWQGEFPIHNTGDDGHQGTAPVGSYPLNSYGLADMIGNVWEWTTDWYAAHNPSTHSCCTISNPRGAQREDSLDPAMTTVSIPRRVMKGGSYLCAPNYCQR
jgi:sulfatase modifying factor 1